jgi:hypothetical protein
MTEEVVTYTVEQLEELYEDALKELDDLKSASDSVKEKYTKLQIKHQILKEKCDQLISERDDLMTKCEYHQNLATNARDEQMKLIANHLGMLSQLGEMIKVGPPPAPARVSSTTKSRIRQQIILKKTGCSEVTRTESKTACKGDEFDWDAVRPQ